MLDRKTKIALIEAVRDAARSEILPRFRSLTPDQISAKSGPTDLVTEADQAMEQTLRTAFETILPGVAFVGEESIAEDPGLIAALDRGEETIILDPIDGTWNFANGLATFGTLLAMSDGQGTHFGLLYDPIVDDWIWSERGAGTYHSNGLRLRTSPSTSDAELAGIYSLVGAQQRDITHIGTLLPRFKAITELRASIWDYRLMCEGHLNFAISRGINPWDHAAGALALTEAGGVARMADGTLYSPKVRSGRLVAAANETVWQTTKDVFAPLIV